MTHTLDALKLDNFRSLWIKIRLNHVYLLPPDMQEFCLFPVMPSHIKACFCSDKMFA